MNDTNFKKAPTNIYELSSRTLHKIIARADLKCSICGWNQATGDIHHIVEVSEGGSNEMSNLIYTCPNCHRTIHQHGDKFKTKAELFELSLEKTFPNWLEFYNPQRNKNFKNSKGIKNHCLTCKVEINHTKKFCGPVCSGNNRQVLDWSYDMIDTVLKNNNGNMTKSGKELNVSDNAIRKQCKKFGIDYKTYKTTYERNF